MKRIFNRLNVILFTFFSVIFVLLFIGVYLYILHMDSLKNNHFNEIDTVDVLLSNDYIKDVKLPSSIQTNQPFDVLVDVSNYEGENNSISFYASYKNVYIYADDEVICKHIKNEKSLTNSGGYYVVFCDIPNDLKNKIITVRFEPLITSLSENKIDTIYYGDKTEILIQNLYSDMLIVIVSFIMILNFLIVILLIISRRDFFDQENYGLLHLAILGLFISFYFLAQTWCLGYLLMSMGELIYFVEYTILFSIFIPVIFFLKHRLDSKFELYYNVILVLFAINGFLQYILTLFKITEFKAMIPCTHALIFVALLLILISFIGTDKIKYPTKKDIYIPMLTIIFIVVIALIYYIIFNYTIIKSISLIILVFFFIIEFKIILNRYFDFKIKIYRELALKDTLTGLDNRAAYIEFEKKFSSKHGYGWAVSIDLNNLKYINDKYGHQAGDNFIRSFSEIIRRESLKKKWVKVFRVGGDEFFVFILKNRQFNIEEWINDIKENFSIICSFNEEFESSFSAGSYYISRSNSITLEKAFNEADKRMYEDKEKYNKF